MPFLARKAPDRAAVRTTRGRARSVVVGATWTGTNALPTPVGLVMEPGGSALVLEFESGRLVHVSPSGTTTTVASGLPTPYGLTRADDGTVYVTKVGEVRRATGALLRVDPDGTVTTIRLRASALSASPAAVSRRAAAR